MGVNVLFVNYEGCSKITQTFALKCFLVYTLPNNLYERDSLFSFYILTYFPFK